MADEWQVELRQIDFQISVGESTAVVVDLRWERMIGVSVGDSAAWVIDGGEIVDLTVEQVRKPLLGSRDARPIAFSHGPLTGVLLVGTDGFFDFAKRDAVPPTISRPDFLAIPRAAWKWSVCPQVICGTRNRHVSGASSIALAETLHPVISALVEMQVASDRFRPKPARHLKLRPRCDRCSSQHVVDDVAVNVRQTEVPPGVAIGQLFMVVTS